jgi:hypothetical protein
VHSVALEAEFCRIVAPHRACDVQEGYILFTERSI